MEAKSAGIVQGWNVDSSDFLSSSPWTRFFVPEPRSRIFSGSLTVDPLFFCPRPSLPTTSFTHAPLCISRMDLGSVTKSRFTTGICGSCRSDEQWSLLWPTRGAKFKRFALLFTAADTRSRMETLAKLFASRIEPVLRTFSLVHQFSYFFWFVHDLNIPRKYCVKFRSIDSEIRAGNISFWIFQNFYVSISFPIHKS